MTISAADERRALHAELKAELFKRQLSNSDNFDKAILQYSSAGLALSLGFLKDFIPLTQASASWLLYFSWGLFLLAVVLTLFSFISSQRAITKQLTLNERYYLQMDDSALSDSNFLARLTDWIGYAAGAAFVVAITCTTFFVSTNLERAAAMTEEARISLNERPTVPTIQKSQSSGVLRGAPVPRIQQVPQQPAQSSVSGTGRVGAEQPEIPVQHSGAGTTNSPMDTATDSNKL